MKIHQLPMGARFLYEGAEYTKTGPLLATGKGGQRLIPKYAVLQVIDGAQATVLAQENLPRGSVLTAFDSFYATCAALVPKENQAALVAARKAFLKALA